MPWRLGCIVVAFLCLGGFTNAQLLPGRQWTSTSNRNKGNDIQFDKDPVDLIGTGSGGGSIPFSDDEDFGESGSGSGSGMGVIDSVPEESAKTTPVTTTTTSTTTSHSQPMSACETMRQASRQLVGKFIPRCLPNGDFDSLQCHGNPGTADCWCSDLEGREIPGTLMEAPNFPNCDEGYNLPPCVHQLVTHVRSKLLGSFRPKCAVDGQFDRVQCHGSMCYCVDEGTGLKVSGTEVHIPDTPNCDDDSDLNTYEATTKKTITEIDIDGDLENESELVFPGDRSETIDLDQSEGVDTNIEGGKGSKEKGSKFDNKNNNNNRAGVDNQGEIANAGMGSQHKGKVEKASEIMTQPGILAGIIGGSVVLLLCLVLLVMFIIYRMRKKDEGSYPLDEPRKIPNYSYVRAPEKEFYA